MEEGKEHVSAKADIKVIETCTVINTIAHVMIVYFFIFHSAFVAGKIFGIPAGVQYLPEMIDTERILKLHGTPDVTGRNIMFLEMQVVTCIVFCILTIIGGLIYLPVWMKPVPFLSIPWIYRPFKEVKILRGETHAKKKKEEQKKEEQEE